VGEKGDNREIWTFREMMAGPGKMRAFPLARWKPAALLWPQMESGLNAGHGPVEARRLSNSEMRASSCCNRPGSAGSPLGPAGP
jgi:hypothetical protein